MEAPRTRRPQLRVPARPGRSPGHAAAMPPATRPAATTPRRSLQTECVARAGPPTLRTIENQITTKKNPD
eukprot:11180422-Lingulodinium_polyedra.AAC.1